jgi:hypothetical protein
VSDKTCTAPEGCDRTDIVGYGLCNKHYLRLTRRGTLEVETLPADQPGERWVPLPGFEGLYYMSNHGRAWSAPRNTTRGGILKQTVDKRGVYWISPSRDGKQIPMPVHRAVMLAFVGPLPEGMEVRHLDGNTANNRWAPGNEEESRAAGGNLIYGTHAENMADMVAHGRSQSVSHLTHCPKGHEYTPENTRADTSSGAACRQCNRDYQREYQREWRLRQLEADPEGFRAKEREYARRAYQKRKEKGDGAV